MNELRIYNNWISIRNEKYIINIVALNIRI
jgi:hypothetical protein